MNRFYVGQEVVVLIDEYPAKKGDVREIQRIMKSPCSCSHCIYDLGYTFGSTGLVGCQYCGHEMQDDSQAVWLFDNEIAPLKTQSEESDMNGSIEEALSEPAFQ